MTRVAAFTFAFCASLFGPCPASAQSGATLDRARISFTSVREYIANDAAPRQLAPPSNLVAPDMYRPLLESMLRGSATFRRQCMRIASDPELIVRLTIGWAPPSAHIRATTTIKRAASGGLSALVQIGALQNLEELIAHELEHVIEQLDGIDLAGRAALPRTGVVAIGYEPGMFETMRAKRAGVRVVSELRR